VATPDETVEGVDYYLEEGNMVFTSTFLLKRGYCCNSGCRHCPYGDDPPKLAIDIIDTSNSDPSNSDPSKGEPQ